MRRDEDHRPERATLFTIRQHSRELRAGAGPAEPLTLPSLPAHTASPAHSLLFRNRLEAAAFPGALGPGGRHTGFSARRGREGSGSIIRGRQTHPFFASAHAAQPRQVPRSPTSQPSGAHVGLGQPCFYLPTCLAAATSAPMEARASPHREPPSKPALWLRPRTAEPSGPRNHRPSHQELQGAHVCSLQGKGHTACVLATGTQGTGPSREPGPPAGVLKSEQ